MLIKPYIADLRGKLGGLVASVNKGGAYLRSKVTPINPQTSAQMLVRSNLAQISQAYGSLTESQRAGWKHLADTKPYPDIFGDMKKLTALAMFVKVNANLLRVEQSLMLDAPNNLDVRGLTPISITITSSVNRQYDLEYGPVNTATESLLIYQATSIRPSVDFVKNQYRLMGYANGLNPSPISLTSPESLGPFVDGNYLWVRVVRLNWETGGMSVAQETKAVIA